MYIFMFIYLHTIYNTLLRHLYSLLAARAAGVCENISNISRSLQTVSQEDGDVTSHNPMLYDPLQDGVVKTSKTRQYLAALVSKCLYED